MNKYLAEVKGDSKVLRGPVDRDEPDHLDYKIKNQFDEWVFKSDGALNNYSHDYDFYKKYIASLPTAFENVEWLTEADNGRLLEEGKDFRINYQCPACGGDGKETCNNPDHGFINAVGGEIQRLGCPGCGHDPNHKVNRGRNVCPECGGYGNVIMEVFEEYGRETGYDEEPTPIAVPIPKQEGKPERMFTLYEMIECANYFSQTLTLNIPKYFKEKFNIDL